MTCFIIYESLNYPLRHSINNPINMVVKLCIKVKDQSLNNFDLFKHHVNAINCINASNAAVPSTTSN